MKLEQQVSSLEPSQKLKSLGVKQESLFYWRLGYSTSESFKDGMSTGRKGNFRDMELTYYPHPRYMTADVKWNQADLSKIDESEVSAFTVAELGEMLPSNTKGRDWFPMKEENSEWLVWEREQGLYTKDGNEFPNEITEADARAKMLIYLLENKLI